MLARALMAAATLGASVTLLAACENASEPMAEPGEAAPSEPHLVKTAVEPNRAEGLEIVTREGVVQGVLRGSTRTFLGIPYVAPTVGALRWTHPRPHEPWATPFAATALGPRCPQTDITGKPGGSEDCLMLNLWAPDRVARPAPVMVYLHGGSYERSTASDPGSDGQLLSEATGAIIVTINYRLGPLGFLADPALTAEDPEQPSSGNYGFEDQRAALEWVRANIAAFAGDPGNVTFFGGSAGATSITLHLRSPLTTGLFQRAILESAVYEDAPVPSADREAQSASLGAAAGCAAESNRIACLRSKSVEELLAAAEATNASWGPVIDGWNLTDCASRPIEAGCLASRVPIVMGTNLNEGEFFLATGLTAPSDDASYLGMMDEMFGGQGAAILSEYPSSSFPSPGKATAEVLTDSGFVCPTRRAARVFVDAGLPVFLYSFNHAPVSPMFPDAGAFHASEIAFVFGSSMWGIQLDEPEHVLSRTMMGYWGRMAANGNPNGAGALAWPALDGTDTSIAFDLSMSTTTQWKNARCNFWDTL